MYENADDDQSFFDYNNEGISSSDVRMASYVHDMSEVEYRDDCARVW